MQKHPELYHAFFGIGLAVDQFRGEQVSLQWTKERVAEAVEVLAQLTFPARDNGRNQRLDYIVTERG